MYLRPPATRGECADVPRPCPWVGCRYHLYLDITEVGSIKFNFPHLEPHELEDSCALDAAEEMGCILEEVAAMMNLTRERVRQIEDAAKAKLQTDAPSEYKEHFDE